MINSHTVATNQLESPHHWYHRIAHSKTPIVVARLHVSKYAACYFEVAETDHTPLTDSESWPCQRRDWEWMQTGYDRGTCTKSYHQSVNVMVVREDRAGAWESTHTLSNDLTERTQTHTGPRKEGGLEVTGSFKVRKDNFKEIKEPEHT